jgi:hypothetical protein
VNRADELAGANWEIASLGTAYLGMAVLLAADDLT